MHAALRSLASAWMLVGLAAACAQPPPAKHPDHDKVAAAQQKWCDMLAELGGERFRHAKECGAAYPGASADFLVRMTTCYGEEMKRYGDDAPDSGAVVSDCTLQILTGVDPGDVAQTVAGRARCARQERCQGISQDVCQSVFDRLDGSAKAMLTNMYNLRSQHELATCLTDGACGTDGDEAEMEKCYQDARQKLVWLPLSL